MSSLQLNYDFEEKLKKFIEENCSYNFTIKIYKTSSGIIIEDAENTTREDLFVALDGLECAADDLHCSIDYEISDEDQKDSVKTDFRYLEEAIYELREKLEEY